MIPKIIHQTAPKDINTWHPVWFECQESWKRNFPESEYQYIMWHDDDIDELVKNNYPEYWNYFKEMRPHIVNIDISRFFILHHYGGIYSDMDNYCYNNFYDRIKTEKTLLVQSQYWVNEKYQNSLMCSEKDNSFFIDCVEESFKRSKIFGFFDIYEEKFSQQRPASDLIKAISGPILLIKLAQDKKYKDTIRYLHHAFYNARPKEYSNKIYVKHMLTGQWGSDVIDYLKNIKKMEEIRKGELIDFGVFRKCDYKDNRNVDLSNFNFYEDFRSPEDLMPEFDYNVKNLDKFMNPILPDK